MLRFFACSRRKDHIVAPGDLIYCSILFTIMRHPVIASDGRRYELAFIYDYLIEKKKPDSPHTRKRITSITYDRALKDMLDENTLLQPERHTNYDETPLLNALKDYFDNPVKSVRSIQKPRR